MLRKLVLAVAVLALSAGWAGSAHAENAPVAREHYQRGTKFYDIGRYDEAIREFEAAYEAKSDPAFIYNLAQAHRLAGHNQEALQLYRNYLRYVPNPANRADIDEHIRGLEKVLAERPSSPPASAPPGQPGATAGGTTPPAPVADTPPAATYPSSGGAASPENQPNGAQAGYPAPGQPEAVGAGAPLQPAPAVPDYGVVSQLPPPAAAPRSSSSRKKAGIVVAAIGGAFLVGGAVSGIVAWSSSKSVQNAAKNGETFDPSVEKTGRAAEVLQWVGYGIGAAGVAVGLILVATSPAAAERPAPPVAALPLIAPGLGGAAVRMTF